MDHRQMWEERFGADPRTWFFGKEPSALGRLAAHFLRVCHGDRPARVVDLGCGEGRDAVFFAQQGHSVTCVELTAAGARKTAYLAAENGVSLEAVHCMDIRDFALGGEHDMIFAGNSLGALGRKCIPTIRRIQRATPRGGINAVRIATREAWGAEERSGHYRFDRNELKHVYRGWRLLYYAEDLLYVPHMDRLASFADIVAQKSRAHPRA